MREHLYHKATAQPPVCKLAKDGDFHLDRAGKVYVRYKGALRKLMMGSRSLMQFITINNVDTDLKDLGIDYYVPKQPSLATHMIAQLDNQNQDLQACKSSK